MVDAGEQQGSADDGQESQDSSTGGNERSDNRLAITTAIVLSVAGLASAWATFQGGVWDKLESESHAIANSYLTESSQLLIRSGQEQAVAAGMFLQWIDAQSDRQSLRANVIENHMPPWFADEFARWRQTLPDDLSTLQLTCSPDWYRSEVESFALMVDG